MLRGVLRLSASRVYSTRDHRDNINEIIARAASSKRPSMRDFDDAMTAAINSGALDMDGIAQATAQRLRIAQLTVG
jgi:hypothetical protein